MRSFIFEQASSVISYLEQLGFDVVGYGCMTCIGNSGPLLDSVSEAIEKVISQDITITKCLLTCVMITIILLKKFL